LLCCRTESCGQVACVPRTQRIEFDDVETVLARITGLIPDAIWHTNIAAGNRSDRGVVRNPSQSRKRTARHRTRATERFGGITYYDYEPPFLGGDGDEPQSKKIPQWLLQWLGDDFFHRVDRVVFFSYIRPRDGKPMIVAPGKLDRDHLKMLHRLPGLREVWINNYVTDDGVRELAKIQGLEIARISDIRAMEKFQLMRPDVEATITHP
jgi:hypothetical protein